MKHCFLPVIFLLIVSVLAAQPVTKAANDAFLITRMAEKFHVQPAAISKTLSANWFDEIVKQLDDDKIFFTQEDMQKLEAWRLQLDNELLSKKTGFLQLLITIYTQRLQQADTMIDNLCKEPFRFTAPDKITVTEDTSRALNTIELRKKIYKHLKATALEVLLDLDSNSNQLLPAQKKKSADSLEIVVRKKIRASYKRAVTRLLQNPGGLTQEVCTVYCQALAVCYDPHSAFFPPTEKENFESQLGNAPLQFGFKLGEDDDGAVIIETLKPGSPAFKSGQLNKGDKIQAIQWEGKEPIDLSGAGGEELNEILSADNHTALILTVKKTDGTIVHVSLVKEKATDDKENNKVKSFLLRGSKTIGYISLPAFYTDWEDAGQGANGCADDVAEEIVKLKKENIAGLIIDLRYNGGGSIQEAVELAGIFIDAGPVAQIKTRDAKIVTLKDVNRGSIYDGPLLLLVNGYSASASEIVAAALQDYNRAIIAGSPTYGKATGQLILPMDTTIDLAGNYQNKKADSYFKITMQKIYRVNGSSAQSKGVQPDIFLPDMLEADPHRESDEKLAFANSSIEANKYYKPYGPLPIAALQASAKTQTDTSTYFSALKKYIHDYQQHLQPKEIPLNWAAAKEERTKDKTWLQQPPVFKSNSSFSVFNHAFEEKRLTTDNDLRKLDDSWKERLLNDAYLQIAFRLLSAPVKP